MVLYSEHSADPLEVLEEEHGMLKQQFKTIVLNETVGQTVATETEEQVLALPRKTERQRKRRRRHKARDISEAESLGHGDQKNLGAKGVSYSCDR